MIDHTLSSLPQFSTTFYPLLRFITTYYDILPFMTISHDYDILRPRYDLSPDAVTHMFELTHNAHNAHIKQLTRERGA